MITQLKNTPATGVIIGKIMQTGTEAPTLPAIINTINDENVLTLTRLAPGQYNIIIPEANMGLGNTRINGTFDGATPLGLSITAFNDNFVQFAVLSATTITMDVKNAAGTRVELSSLGGGLIHIPVKIEVINYIID